MLLRRARRKTISQKNPGQSLKMMNSPHRNPESPKKKKAKRRRDGIGNFGFTSDCSN